MITAAITTKFHGPTNTKGSRIKATARKAIQYSDYRLPELAHTTHRDCALSIARNHCHAAQALAEKLQWTGLWIAGGSPDNHGYVYVNAGPYSLAACAMSSQLGTEGEDYFVVQESN